MNKAAFLRLQRSGTTPPQGAPGWGGGFGTWLSGSGQCTMTVCLQILVLSGLASGRMLSFSRGQAPLLLYGPLCKDWRMHVVERISSRLSIFLLSQLLAVEIPSETSIKGAEQLAEIAEMICGWLTTAGEKRRELASSPRGLWLDTQQETGRAQQIHWKSHLLHGSKQKTVCRTRK